MAYESKWDPWRVTRLRANELTIQLDHSTNIPYSTIRSAYRHIQTKGLREFLGLSRLLDITIVPL